MARLLTARHLSLMAFAAASLGAGQASAADTATGSKIFQNQCSACHQTTKNTAHSVGPNLFGVVGSRAGAVPGFHFSKGMKQSGITWTPENLKRYLANPQAVVPGNAMPFAGIKDPQELAALVSYLESLK